MSNPRSSRLSSGSITSEHFRDTRARAWAFVFQCWQEKQMTTEPAAEPNSCNDAAIVRNTEEVSDVEQQPDGPSEIVVTHSRKLRTQ